jgi:hypothetical protein
VRRLHVILGLAVVLLLVGGVATASIPDASGVIHGCRKNTDGSIRVIDTAKTSICPNGYTPLNWNQTGAQGPTGPAGVSGYQIVFNSFPVVVGGMNADIAVEVYCPEGKRALGGGGQIPSDRDPSVQWVLTYSRPLTFPGAPTDPAIGWLMQAHRFGSTSTTSGGISAWAICATVN